MYRRRQDREAVLREYREALQDKNYKLAVAIELANPDISDDEFDSIEKGLQAL